MVVITGIKYEHVIIQDNPIYMYIVKEIMKQPFVFFQSMFGGLIINLLPSHVLCVNLSGLHIRSDGPPAPKVIVQRPADITAMEQLISQLRTESVTMANQLSDSLKIQKSLRKDLAGSKARLSDVHGQFIM